MDLKMYLAAWHERFGTASVPITSPQFQQFMRWVASQNMHIDGGSEYLDSHNGVIWLNHKGMIWLTTTK